MFFLQNILFSCSLKSSLKWNIESNKYKIGIKKNFFPLVILCNINFQFRSKFYLINKQWLLFMLCPFTGPKIFCASPNLLSQPKTLSAFSASSKTFVPAQKPILLNANHLFVWHKMFVTATFLVWHKKFGPTFWDL